MSSDREHIADPFLTSSPAEPANAWWRARRQVADATRELIQRFTESRADARQLEALAERIRGLTAGLSSDRETMGFSAFANEGGHGDNDQIVNEINPVIGHANPIAPPLEVWFEDGKCKSTVCFPYQYEGPPNYVHGGCIAAVFDQLCGVAQTREKVPGVTGTLSVRYMAPVPLNETLTALAYVDRMEGRKIFVKGEMYCDDRQVASCEALFIRWKEGAYEDIEGNSRFGDKA